MLSDEFAPVMSLSKYSALWVMDAKWKKNTLTTMAITVCFVVFKLFIMSPKDLQDCFSKSCA